MSRISTDGVLITGVYGSGKSSVAAEIAFLLERRGEPYALLDLAYLSWADAPSGDRASEVTLMLANLKAVAANYRRAGISRLVLAYFNRTRHRIGRPSHQQRPAGHHRRAADHAYFGWGANPDARSASLMEPPC